MIQTRKLILIITPIILIIAIVGVSLLYFFVPMKKPGKQIVVMIDSGTTVRTIANVLKEKKVIPNAKAFLIWIKLNKIEKTIQAGKHTFHEYEGIVKAAQKLLSAEPVEKSVTVPEGLTIEQTANSIAKVFDIDTAEFIKICYDTNVVREFGISSNSLEGYLFPDTYLFNPDEFPINIIKRMVMQFEDVYSSINPTEISKKYSKHGIVSIASIVEKEATLSEEHAHIAGVFYNRLKKGMPLGADPTIRYALKKFSGPLRVSELNNPSPYNTRIHTGIPPGPICSPGKAALLAAFEPMETKDLFFVAKWDGSGTHDFSVTNAQHDKKKREIRRKNILRISKKLKEKP